MRKSKYTHEYLAPIVQSSYSMAEVIRRLGLNLNGGNYRQIAARIKHLELDTSHFTGQGWSKGRTVENDIIVRRIRSKIRYSNDDVFRKNSVYISGTRLLQRLIALGVDYVCSECGLTHWRNQKITLHVDHIDGDNSNNEFDNLRLLCPNCHQLTETWGNKNRKKQAA